MQTGGRNSDELLLRKVPGTTPKEYVGRLFHYGKAVSVPQKSADHLKPLLPLAASQFLNPERNCFVEGFEGDESAIRQKLEFSKADDEATCLNNKNRLHTTSFKYQGSRRFLHCS